MTESRWLQLTAREYAMVLDALSSMLNADPANKATIFAMVERGGRVKAEVVPSRTASTLQGEVIEHVQDGLGLLAEVARVVGPGGRLVLSTPDHAWARRLWLGVSRRAFEEHFEPRSDHVRFFTRRTLAGLLCAGGFEQIEIRRAQGVLLATARAAR